MQVPDSGEANARERFRMRCGTIRWWQASQREFRNLLIRLIFSSLIVFIVLEGAHGVAPQSQQSVPSGWSQSVQNPFQDLEGINPALARRQLRALNEERQKDLAGDTIKLLQLARKLDAEVKVSDDGRLTPDQLRQVERIEKLARSVKKKMVETYGGGPVFRPPMVPARQ